LASRGIIAIKTIQLYQRENIYLGIKEMKHT